MLKTILSSSEKPPLSDGTSRIFMCVGPDVSEAFEEYLAEQPDALAETIRTKVRELNEAIKVAARINIEIKLTSRDYVFTDGDGAVCPQITATISKNL